MSCLVYSIVSKWFSCLLVDRSIRTELCKLRSARFKLFWTYRAWRYLFGQKVLTCVETQKIFFLMNQWELLHKGKRSWALLPHFPFEKLITPVRPRSTSRVFLTKLCLGYELEYTYLDSVIHYWRNFDFPHDLLPFPQTYWIDFLGQTILLSGSISTVRNSMCGGPTFRIRNLLAKKSLLGLAKIV